MFEVYLISVFSLLLSEYGFQTRKNAMERFGAPFRWGRTIGRFAIWAAIGFTVAAKAVARYPQFKNSAFAEYFLIGTLSSVGLATLIALLVSIP